MPVLTSPYSLVVIERALQNVQAWQLSARVVERLILVSPCDSQLKMLKRDY